MAVLSNQKRAQESASARAARALAGVDLPLRCAALGLDPPGSGGRLRMRVLGRELEFTPPDFQGRERQGGARAHPVERLLALRYLLCDVPFEPAGKLISFRDFPGGKFYWPSFLARTAAPLTRAIGNDLALLRERLGRFEWRPVEAGDLGARIHALGKIELTLVYHAGDEEFPADSQVLFDASLKRVFGAEEAVALASRLCQGLCSRG